MFINKKRRINILVRLLEGPEIKVPCLALHIQNDIFEIIRNTVLDLSDRTAVWEFFPGDVVRCVRINSNWIAHELISSTLKNRRVYQLLFIIVESLGEIQFDALVDYIPEMKILLNRTDILQTEHPLVRTWVERNMNKIQSL